MTKIEVRRRVHIEQPNILEEAMVLSVGYVSNTQDSLLESVGYGGQREYYFRARRTADSGYTRPPTMLRRSDDNGQTWTPVVEWPEYKPLGGRRRLQIGEPNFTVHPKTGAIVALYRTNEDIEGLLPWAPESPVAVTGKVWTAESRDGGRTWSEPRQVIIRGREFDETHWAPDVWYGKNSGCIEGISPIHLSDDRFVLPFDAWDINDPRHHKAKIAALIGEWKADGGIEWDLGAYTTVRPEFSNSGAQEPCVAVLPGGRLMMSIRVRVDPNDGTQLPSGKFYVVSDDLGQTWSEPQPFHYDDGQQVYCPACLAHIFTAANGRLYMITNYLDKPTRGCDPRTTLQIAEVDVKTFRVLRDTLTVIETRQPDQLETIRFSNWRRYEERQTKKIILYMTGCPGDQGRHETCRVPPHSFRYEITLPELTALRP